MDYTEKKINNITEKLKSELDEFRFIHSLGCAECAEKMAPDFNINPQKAYVAGLLHDCAKCFPRDKMYSYLDKIELKEGEAENYKVLHAPVSAYVAKHEYEIDDEEILSSIRWHTIGHTNMSDFEKIIFLADKIEQRTRCLEYSNSILAIIKEPNGLNKALFTCYKATIKSLVERELKICQDTIDIYNSLV